MQKINFTKMVASGNDFVLIDTRRHNSILNTPACSAGRQYSILKQFAQHICDRKYGAGADGLLILEKSKIADVRMRIFNSDGSEAEMCGNGARCSVLYVGRNSTRLQTKAGIVESQLKGDNVRIKLTDPRNTELDIPVKIGGRTLNLNFVDTGVPHAVIFTEGLDKINIKEIGSAVRYHRQFAPRGTNVDFVEVLNADSIRIRTYERGVEDETLACGTGSVASAVIFALKSNCGNKINVHTKSTEVLKVYFERTGNNIKNTWLEGKASVVYNGCWHNK